jgi:hypothetical protein
MPRDSEWFERLLVEPSKITGYLLSPTNEYGRHKRRFVVAHGFADGHPDVLRDALLAHTTTAVELVDTATVHGRTWVLRGRLRCPTADSPWCKRFRCRMLAGLPFA